MGKIGICKDFLELLVTGSLFLLFCVLLLHLLHWQDSHLVVLFTLSYLSYHELTGHLLAFELIAHFLPVRESAFPAIIREIGLLHLEPIG